MYTDTDFPEITQLYRSTKSGVGSLYGTGKDPVQVGYNVVIGAKTYTVQTADDVVERVDVEYRNPARLGTTTGGGFKKLDLKGPTAQRVIGALGDRARATFIGGRGR